MRKDRAAPVSLHSIAFAYVGASDAILLRDHATGQLVGGATPEWTAGEGGRAPAAYVRGAQPTIHVVLSRSQKPGSPVDRVSDEPNPECTVYATGAGGPGITPQRIALEFDEAGLTAPIEFRLSEPLPIESGRLLLSWSWFIQVASQELALGTSSHDICLSAGPIKDPESWLGERAAMKLGVDAAAPWTYSRIMEWTCEWAAGLEDDKAIVDAIMKNLWRSGLRYAVGETQSDPKKKIEDMLLHQGAYCGTWTRMFQAMAASQGVTVLRRGFWVDWRVLSAPRRELWCALVISKGGINREEPEWDASTFHDADWPPDDRTIEDKTERRYVFWGWPNSYHDGHAINVLEYHGSQYLYDPSFARGPIPLDRPLPEPDLHKRIDVADLGKFHQDYLSDAGAYMLGLMPWGSHKSSAPGRGGRSDAWTDPFVNGLTIPAAKLDTPRDSLTFLWT
jgi:hypothetical protein